MAMLVSDLLHRVGALLNDLSPQFQRWTENELVDWANDGQVAIAKFLPSTCGRADVVKLLPGARQVLGGGVIPGVRILPGDGGVPVDMRVMQIHDLVRNMGQDGKTPGLSVSVVSREDMDATNRMWHTTRPKAKVEHFCIDARVPGTIYVHPPVPQDSSVWVEILWAVCHPSIPYPKTPGEYGVNGGDSTEIGVPDAQVDDLIHYICARAWQKDAEFASASMAQFYQNLFLQSINAQVEIQTGHNPNLKVLPLSLQVPAAAS